MVGVEGSGRQLPGWMLGVSASAQVEKSDKVKVKEKPVEEGLSSEASVPGPRSKKGSLREEENLSEGQSALAKCTKKRSRQKDKSVNAESDVDVNIVDDVAEKKPLPRQKRRKAKDYRSIEEELDIEPVNVSVSEDLDLTVEDLMTIAKEYVGSDWNMEQDRASKSKCEQQSKSLTILSSRNESINHDYARICDQTKTMHDTTNPCPGETNSVHDVSSSKKLESSSTEEIVVNINRTGDPAQDMMYLFLGPLLKKPVAEKKRDFEMPDADLFQHLGIQSKTSVGRGETAPFIKKKSSLKDKVSSLLE